MTSIDRAEQRIKEIKMTDNAVVQGEYVTYSHIKTRKTFSITVEFPEEQALQVLNTLGAPVGGWSKPVAVCLLDKTVTEKTVSNSTPLESEGDKVRVRAVILCKEESFARFLDATSYNLAEFNEQAAKECLIDYCGIFSRSELTTNPEAQKKLKELDRQYKEWLNPVDEQYKDNLERL